MRGGLQCSGIKNDSGRLACVVQVPELETY